MLVRVRIFQASEASPRKITNEARKTEGFSCIMNTLNDLIKCLEKLETLYGSSCIIKLGFENPHSYRGYYDHLSFEPTRNVTIKKLLKYANSACGRTYTAWKGGEYCMTGSTITHLANEGGTSCYDISDWIDYVENGNLAIISMYEKVTFDDDVIDHTDKMCYYVFTKNGLHEYDDIKDIKNSDEILYITYGIRIMKVRGQSLRL